MSDIVARLRERVERSLYTGSDVPGSLMHEAADEIEHLREWKELAYEIRNRYWWCMRSKTLRKFDAMHKADWKRHKPLGDTRA